MTDTRQNVFKGRVSAPVLALLVMLCWGSLFPMIKLGYDAFGIDTSSIPSILLFAGVRFVICGLALVTCASVREKKLAPPSGRALMPVLMIALAGYIMHYTLTYVGVSKLDGSKTAVLKQIGSLFIVSFAFLFRKEDKFSPLKLAGGILGFASILVVNLKGFTLSFSVYDIMVVGASFCSVASIVFSKNAYDTLSPLYVTAWAQLAGGAVLLTLGLALGGRFGDFTPRAALVLGYMCLASCAGYILWNTLLKYNDMSRLSVIKFTETLFAALCSWALLGEDIFRWEYLLALGLVSAGVVISGLKRKHTLRA